MTELNEQAVKGTSEPTPKVRLDKWLWYTRLFKSRTLAGAKVSGGGFRVNRELVKKARHGLQTGDVVTFSKGPYIRVIEVVALGTRRGPASEAQLLYKDLSPPETQPSGKNPKPTPGMFGYREPGAGRPTKKQRREVEQLRDGAYFDGPPET
ncbi:MAG: RNA-binding S4 domain-containing protein [Alphaproteobacteria bacterium]|nr:RNA-binding S4 domain-containing protein [Alphaproteobacteria bacterium]